MVLRAKFSEMSKFFERAKAERILSPTPLRSGLHAPGLLTQAEEVEQERDLLWAYEESSVILPPRTVSNPIVRDHRFRTPGMVSPDGKRSDLGSPSGHC
mmetsp:Transcript_2189/g.6513  ORF Transcript_2189/g.6513 Transcript_2189/m.6513 type:complete len:99 (-) Transcript_2189:221-517(-)